MYFFLKYYFTINNLLVTCELLIIQDLSMNSYFCLLINKGPPQQVAPPVCFGRLLFFLCSMPFLMLPQRDLCHLPGFNGDLWLAS